FVLLILKGLPTFAESHLLDVVLWVYSVTWIPALLAGILLSAVVVPTVSRTRYFHQPYDFGRCLSLGAIVGSIVEALATLLYRSVSHHLFSGFWIAGATIAGCLSGASVVTLWLWTLSKRRVR